MIIGSFHHVGRSLVRALALCLTGFLVAACDQSPPEYTALTPRVTTFDGTYQGVGKAMRQDRDVCTATWTVPVVIQNGEVSHYWNASLGTTVKGLIAADGSFSAKAYQHGNLITLVGKVDGSTLVADAKGQFCDYHLEYTKS
jgi:hypothetical protein